jgi:Icc-related predicted phosphoesterase
MAISHRVTRILCAAAPRGSQSAVEGLLEAIEQRDVHAVALVGDLSRDGGAPEAYRTVLRALARPDRPAYWVPGDGDVPLAAYLRAAYAIESTHPQLHGVHGTAAFAPDGHVVFAGLGGQIDDDPEAERDELERLRYPRWEAEYRLKLLDELAEHQRVLLFSTPPAHKGLGSSGSEAVAELVNTFRPRLVVCGGERGAEQLGASLVVAPGDLSDGHYAIADLHSHQVELAELVAA